MCVRSCASLKMKSKSTVVCDDLRALGVDFALFHYNAMNEIVFRQVEIAKIDVCKVQYLQVNTPETST